MTAASVAADSLGSVLGDAFGSPVGILLQLAMLAALVLLLRVDWAGLLARRERRQRAAPAGNH